MQVLDDVKDAAGLPAEHHHRRTAKRPRNRDDEVLQQVVPVKQLSKAFLRDCGVCPESRERVVLVWTKFEHELQELGVHHADVGELAELFESFVERRFSRSSGHLHCRICGVAYRLQQTLWRWAMTAPMTATTKHRSSL